jgi:hypothetical protein
VEKRQHLPLWGIMEGWNGRIMEEEKYTFPSPGFSISLNPKFQYSSIQIVQHS